MFVIRHCPCCPVLASSYSSIKSFSLTLRSAYGNSEMTMTFKQSCLHCSINWLILYSTLLTDLTNHSSDLIDNVLLLLNYRMNTKGSHTLTNKPLLITFRMLAHSPLYKIKVFSLIAVWCFYSNLTLCS